MQITSIENYQGSWHGTAGEGEKKYQWFYWPRRRFRVMEEEPGLAGCWLYVEPPPAAKRAVLRAIRKAAA
jgi:hypothetical protein